VASTGISRRRDVLGVARHRGGGGGAALAVPL